MSQTGQFFRDVSFLAHNNPESLTHIIEELQPHRCTCPHIEGQQRLPHGPVSVVIIETSHGLTVDVTESGERWRIVE